MEQGSERQVAREQATENQLEGLRPLAGPLLDSFAFKRLEKITFLGLLSPKFRELKCPLFKQLQSEEAPYDGGSRLDHSVGVAWLSRNLCQKLEPHNEILHRYAVAWGLVHDLATWPLSHSGEPAFSAICKVSARDLRAKMIRGQRDLPPAYCINEALIEMGINPETLLALFDKNDTCPKDLVDELRILRNIVHSPITPDTLEGMARTGRVFRVKVEDFNFWTDVFEWTDALEKDLFGDVDLVAESMNVFTDFWKGKQKIYKQFINKETTVAWESGWSTRISEAFAGCSLIDTLELPEGDIIQILKESYERRLQETPLANPIFRYKPPQEYFINKKATGFGQLAKGTA